MRYYLTIRSEPPNPPMWQPGKLLLKYAPMFEPFAKPAEPSSELAIELVRETDLCIYRAMAHNLK